MAYDLNLAQRIRDYLKKTGQPVEEKKMMGGLTFMVNGKMCVGVLNEDLMARIAPEDYKQALTHPGCRKMDLTGRPMKGFVFIDKTGTGNDDPLQFWINMALAYNPRAKTVKKSKKKQ